MKKWLLVFTIMIFGAIVSNAAGIDGKWKTTMEGPDGKMELTFTFKTDGTVLTGSISTPMGEMPISNGKVNGNEFSFDIDMMGNAMPHNCTLDGDTIKMKIVGGPDGGGAPGGGVPREMILKRVVE